MKPLPTQLPKGTRIYLPDEAARKRHVETRLFEVFGRWGYREIVTPTFEFFDAIASGTDQALQENMFKFVDRDTGRMLALRADVTPQIARIAATRLRDRPKPYRLAYRTNVFRHEAPRLGRMREFYQAGVELLGLDKPAMDRIRQMVVDQLCAATGGPCVYVGKTMKESHATLDITNEIFDQFVGHIRATLVRFAVPSREQNELLGALAGMRAEIVTK